MANQNNFHVNKAFLEQIIRDAAQIIDAQNVCILFLSGSNQFECMHGSSCVQPASPKTQGCGLAVDKISSRLINILDGKKVDGSDRSSTLNSTTLNEHGVIAENKHMHIVFPLKLISKLHPGILVFQSKHRREFTPEHIKIARSIAELCSFALHKSEMLLSSDRMIKKLNLLSDASNVLLSEFENRPLSEKLDYVVMKTLEILDAELCTLWLVDGDCLKLKTSFTESGKVTYRKEKKSPITKLPESGLTGHIAFQKKLFNCYGEELQKLRNQAKMKPVSWVHSKSTFSELAHPLLDENDNLLGILFAYNKKDLSGHPTREFGFTAEFDEPLMKILTTKIAISIKNARQLEKLRSYELIIESTPDPVVISSQKGKITYMNSGAKILFGDLVGCPAAQFYPTDENSDGITKAREVKKQLLASPDQRLKNLDSAYMSKDGEVIPISLSLSLLHDDRGEEVGIVGIAKDLREIKALVSAGQSLLETHDIDEILSRITQTSLRLRNSVRAYIKLHDEKSDRLFFRALNSQRPGEGFPAESTPKDEGMTGYVFRTQKPLLSNDVSMDPYYGFSAIFNDVKSKIVVPITYLDKETCDVRRLGIISVDSDKLNAFSTNDLYFLSNLANQAAVAWQNANLITSKNENIKRLRAFDRVQQSTTGKNLNIDKIFDAIIAAVVEVLGYEYATISVTDKVKQVIGTVKGRNVEDEFLSSAWHPLDSKDIQAWVARNKKAVYLTGWDERLDKEIFERYQHDRLVRVIIPIIARGEVLGTLETGHDKSDNPQITEEEIATLQKLVNLAAVGIEQAKLLHRLQEDIILRNELEKQLDALNQASIQILNSTKEVEAINHMFNSLERIGYTKGMLSLVNEETGTIEGKYPFGDNWRRIPLSQSIYKLRGKNILSQAISSKKPVLCRNCTNDPRWNKKLAREAKIRSQYIIPLIVKNKPIGTLQIDLSDWQELVHGKESLLERRMKVLETFASQSAIAIRNIRDTVTIDRLEENIAETAHEFRSPMHNIMTQLGGLKDTLEHNKDEKEIDRFVNIIEEQIYRANMQVNNSLLASERIHKKMEFDFKAGHIQHVIKNCVDAYKLRALERGISIIVRDNINKLPAFTFDRAKIEQAMTNLIDNAVKYSHYNQYVEVTGFDDGTIIHIEISDRGMGIPPDEFAAIFKGFTRSEAKDRIRYIPGTGLGLKICKEILASHNGRICVNSVPMSKSQQKIKDFQDYRTTFKVTLPKQQKENT